MLVSLTVGKVDAGVAVLLTEDKRLIEFPSILLPNTITSGSIVDITVQQNFNAEEKSQAAFASLQSRILNTYGLQSPSPPVLKLRNATQTSLVLEWEPLQLATSTLKSLSLFRNGSKAGTIPRPHEMLATKISGLAVDTEYSFHMILRTTGGTFSSPVLTCRTHKMTDLSGITVSPGILPGQLKDSLAKAVQRIGGKLVELVRIDTTHFVCTEGRGREWERARDMNIPIVRPEWIEGCEREGRLVGVRGYYLDANPKDRNVGPNPSLSQSSTNQTQSGGEPQQYPFPPQRQASGPGAPGNGGPLSPGQIQQLPTASVSSANLGETVMGGSQANLQKRMGLPMSPNSADLQRRASMYSTASAEVPDGVEDGGPGPEVPPTPPPKDGSKRRDEEGADDEDEEDDDEGQEDRNDDPEEAAAQKRDLEKVRQLELADRSKEEQQHEQAARATENGAANGRGKEKGKSAQVGNDDDDDDDEEDDDGGELAGGKMEDVAL